MAEVNFYMMDKAVMEPKKGRTGDAGYDLAATQDIWINAGHTVFCGTGIKAEIPSGYVGLLFVRSGIGVKHNITLANGTGVIDSNYRGEIKAALFNNGTVPYMVIRGDRVVQLVITPIHQGIVKIHPTDEHISSTDRGKSGFGSSGA